MEGVESVFRILCNAEPVFGPICLRATQADPADHPTKSNVGL